MNVPVDEEELEEDFADEIDGQVFESGIQVTSEEDDESSEACAHLLHDLDDEINLFLLFSVLVRTRARGDSAVALPSLMDRTARQRT